MACPDLTPTDALRIFNQIVQHFGQRQQGGVNTFAVTYNRDDEVDEKFGRTYEDFLNGFFWSRRWVKSGASRSEMRAEYPALLAQVGNSRRPNLLRDKDECFDIWLLLIDEIDCSDCEDKDRSIPTIEQEVMRTLNRIIDEAYTYKLYESDTMPGQFVWFSDAHADFLSQQGNFPFTQCTPCREVELTIPTNDYPVDYRQWQRDDTHVGLFARLTFCVCANVDDGAFNFDTANVNVGVTACEHC